jgi:hypothetical protein
MRPRRDFVMSEGRDHVLCMLMSGLGVLQRLPGMLVPRQVILLPALLVRGAMGMRGDIVKFRRPLVVFVMRSVVIARRHT